MLRKPWYQQLWFDIASVLAGFLLLGAALDSITNAIGLITWQMSCFGSGGLLAFAIGGHFALRKWPLRGVVIGGHEVRFSGFGRKLILGIVGAVILLWTPHIRDVFRTPPLLKEYPQDVNQPIPDAKVEELSAQQHGNSQAETKQPIPDLEVESLVMHSERVNADYATEFRRVVSVSRTMPSPAFIVALWDVTVINNGKGDVSLVDYAVQPLGDLPGAGPYYEPYDQGLVDIDTNEPLHLPINLAAGHALRFRVRSFIVVPTQVAMSLLPQVPWNTTLQDIFFKHLYTQGIDCFGNRVTPGPGGYSLMDDALPRDQRLQFNIRTGRGKKLKSTLTWYKERSGSIPWPGKQRGANPASKERR